MGVACTVIVSIESCWSAIYVVPSDFPTVQSAINAAADGDTILIADGTYSGVGNYDIDFFGKSVSLQSMSGPNYCVIDCQGQGRGLIFQSGETLATRVVGLTIRNGYTLGVGGGVRCLRSSPYFQNCRIEQNISYFHGGGVDCYFSAAQFEDCKFIANVAGTNGGALCGLLDSTPYLLNCTLNDNTALIKGGACFLENSRTTFVSCEFARNTAHLGGAVYIVGVSGARLDNCLLVQNLAYEQAGAIFCESAGPPLTNCTFWANSASLAGGALYCDRSQPTVSNSILWENQAVAGPEIYLHSEATGSVLSIEFSDVAGGQEGIAVEEGSSLFWGAGMFSANPLFQVGPRGATYLSQLAAGQPVESPCVNAGSAFSAAICIPPEFPVICLDALTTRIDSIQDAEVVDLGFHYLPASSVPSTVTPLPPTEPPPTPSPGITPSPTRTPEIGVSLFMPSQFYHPHDWCCLLATITLTSANPTSLPLFVVLEWRTQYWFWPSWVSLQQGTDYREASLRPGDNAITVIDPFEWPDTGEEAIADLRFLAGVTDSGGTTILGSIGEWQFGYGPE